MMSFPLSWMRPEAPYMPIAVAGLLSALEDAGRDATAVWREGPDGIVLELGTDLAAEEIADAVIEAPWPDLAEIDWATKLGQAIKPMLAGADDPARELQRLRTAAAEAGLVAETRLLNCLVTEAALDDGGAPSRNRLLRGVKSDLSSVNEKVKLDRDKLARELTEGPQWVKGKSGRGLGLVPELQTFGGTTGREPSQVGSHSVLLYRLLWLGLLSLPPYGVVLRGRRVVGGPLVTDQSRISWPVWTVELGLSELKTYFCLSVVHEDERDGAFLAGRGIARVYSAEAVPINSMVSVFRWGRRVA